MTAVVFADLVGSTGIFERLDNLVGRIRLSEGYTPEIGAALGILPAQPSAPIPADDLQPSLKALAMPGSVVQVSFIRGNTNGVALETRVDNADTWSDAGRFYSSPASLVIPENAQGLPRAVQMRARFIDGNTPVGQFSATISTSTQPAV